MGSGSVGLHTCLLPISEVLQDGHQIYSSFGEAIAIMAFTLSELPTHVSRTKMLREMWNTGAETMVGAHSSPSQHASRTETAC